MIKLSKAEKLEKFRYFEKYLGEGNNATLSEVDANSNIGTKSIASYSSEFLKPEQKQINLFIWQEYIEKLFGRDAADKFIEDMNSDVVYFHDLSGGLLPYCVAIDLNAYILNGNKSIGGTSRAPKHLASFCGGYINLVYNISSQFSGAIADVSLLTYFDYFARKDFGDNYLEEKTDTIKQQLQLLIYTLNEPSGSRGNQSIFYNTSIFDYDYWYALFGKRVMPNGSLPVWESVDKLQWFFMSWFNEERTKELLTFPVITCAYLTNKQTRKPQSQSFVDKMAVEMSHGNSFFIYSSDSVDSLASCCRLKNQLNMDDSGDENTFSYTLGGTGIQSGSKKVITINFNRLGQMFSDLKKNDFVIKGNDYVISVLKPVLESLVSRIHTYLAAYNEILWKEYNAGILKVYSAGFISLDKQYLTVGVNGMVELAEWLGYTISNNPDYIEFLSQILKIIKVKNKEDNKIYSDKTGHKVRFNTEFVPAESLGVRNAQKDKKAGLEVNRDCYNSYFYIVEDDSIDIFSKADLYCDKVMDSLDGGSAYHMNLAEIPDKDQWIYIIDYMSKVGCNYWTYNVMSTCCENPKCGYINKNTEDYCVKCGSDNITYATRVIGYLTKISNWSKDRQEEGQRRYYNREIREQIWNKVLPNGSTLSQEDIDKINELGEK